jgi:hypothetical protein
LARGSFGKIIPLWEKERNEPMEKLKLSVLKIIKTANEHEVQHVLTEMAMMEKCHHHNVMLGINYY